MTKMTLDEIHDVNLDILKHIKAFCDTHKIKWWLSEGTLLGAVRHHGFIPWDDDTDIMLPREDYDRFISEYRDTSKFKLYCPERGNSYLNYARLCEMEDTYFKQTSPWTEEAPGIGIDVLPLDGCPASDDDFVAYSAPLVANRLKLLTARAMVLPRPFRHDIKGFCKDVVHYVIRKLKLVIRKKIINQRLLDDANMRQQYSLSDNSCCTFILGSSNPKTKKWQKAWFEKVILTEFEGEMLPIPSDYDARLKAEYGDYMTPPPEGKRGDHAAWQTMYWRNK